MRNWIILIILIGILIPFSCLSQTRFYISEEDNIQVVIDKSSAGDTLVLRDGIFCETITVTKALTIRAEHPGEAMITNRYPNKVRWIELKAGTGFWYTQGIDWPVHRLLVDGVHAFDYRTKDNFDKLECGPYWSKGWQEGRTFYPVPPIYFARDSATQTLWLRLDDSRNPNDLQVDFNSRNIGGQTLVQKDLGAAWNQQQIVVVSDNPPVYPVVHWYEGTEKNPAMPRIIKFPKICGIVVNIKADDVTLEGLHIHMAPTVGVEVNNSNNVRITDCYFSGYQYAINTGYECTNLTVIHCEMDGGLMVSKGGHRSVNDNMWNHSTYINPIKFNGTGLIFRHNYVYEGYDLFHPRGRHKDFGHVADLRSDVGYNVWQNNLDNVAEFDGVEALMNLRFHHNLVLSTYDALAITTTENGGPLTIDHNIWWPGGGRIMKLVGTGRTNRGVEFVHNTYFTGETSSFNQFENSIFENNIVISECVKESWTVERLGSFFPTKYNLLKNGERYAPSSGAIFDDPKLGDTPSNFFLLQKGSPAINAGVLNEEYQQCNVSDKYPDLGALEYGEDIDSWLANFGHCGPRWITRQNQSEKAPQRPEWPAEIDRRWGGL